MFLVLIVGIVVDATSPDEATATKALERKGAVFFAEGENRHLIISQDGWEGRTAPWAGDENDLKLVPMAGRITSLEFAVNNRTLAHPDCLDFLPKLARLRRLEISLNKETSRDSRTLEWISRCPNLEELTIFNGCFRDCAIAPLQGMKLRRLSIASACLTNKSTGVIETMRMLEVLFLAGPDYSDQELLRLAEHLPRLKELTLPTSSSISSVGVRDFKRRLPECRLSLSYPK